jgi:hypothetical protein
VTDQHGQAKKQVALLVAPLSSFLGSFSMGAINAAFPSIGRDLSLDAALLARVNTRESRRWCSLSILARLRSRTSDMGYP